MTEPEEKAGTPGAPAPPSVLIAIEQLRRAVPGGIGTYAYGLLGGLAQLDASRLAAGEEPTAITLFASRVAPDPLARWGRPVRTSSLRSRVLTRAWDLGLARAPAGFDVVHAVSLAAPPLARRNGGALTVMVHDLAWRSHPDSTTPRGRRWHEGALLRTLRRANAFVVPSLAVADALIAGGAPADSVHVIGLGSDHLPPPDVAAAEATLRGSGVDGPYLLAVATLEPRKNFSRLLDAYSVARSALPVPLPLVVAGPIGWGDAGLGETTGVVAVGHVDDAALSGLYAGAAGFAYVPLIEGFGLPPIEAMRAGVPVVVSSSVPSVTECDGDPPALVVDPGDTDAIAAALIAVASDSALAASLRARGSAFTASRTWEAVAASHLAIWERLA